MRMPRLPSAVVWIHGDERSMSTSLHFIAASVMFLFLGAHTGAPIESAQSKAPSEKAAAVNHASGMFDVKLEPQPPEEKVGDPTIGRFSIQRRSTATSRARAKDRCSR